MWKLVARHGVWSLDHIGIPSPHLNHLAMVLQNTFDGFGVVMKAFGSLVLVTKHSSIHIWTWETCGIGYQVWCEHWTIHVYITSTFGNGDPKHVLQCLWLWHLWKHLAAWDLLPNTNQYIYGNGNMWKLIARWGVWALDHSGLYRPPHLAMVIENTFNVFGVVIKALGSFLLVSKPLYIQIWAWKWCGCTPDLAHLGIYPPWTNWILHTLHLVLHIQQYTPWTLCILCCTVEGM